MLQFFLTPLLPFVRTALILSAVLFFTRYADQKLTQLAPHNQHRGQNAEVLYLPNGEFLAALSFGYRNTFANVLWLNTLNYFGKHRRSDQNYPWLGHMCGLVTELNPRALAPFTFCANMLAWEAQAPENAISILNKAIKHHPLNWELYYLRGFTAFYFLRQADKAKEDFVFASTLPGVHPLVVRLAAQKLLNTENAATAVEFLENILSTTTDPSARQALESRLREALFHRDIEALNDAMQVFISRTGRQPINLDEIATAGIISLVPREPFGGSYIVDEATGTVQGTSAQAKRLMSKIKS